MPKPKKKALPFAEEREILDAWIPSDPARPVYTALRIAFIERFAHYHQLLTETVSKGPQKGTLATRDKLDRLDKESMQLAGLFVTRSNLWVVRDWRQPPILKFLLRAMKYTRGGRPATKLHIAVQAKEMRLADPKRWTWPKIIAALCDCGEEHTIRCQDNLRREVLHLKKLMSKLRCPISARPGGNTP